MARKFPSEMVTLVMTPEGGLQEKAFQTGHASRSHNRLGIFEDSKAALWLEHSDGGREREMK